MSNKLKILYVHGLNSNSESITGKNIEKILKEFIPDYEIEVSHPTFSKIADEAIKTLKKEIRDCDIVIGTSLGGFVALNARGKYRIVVNPALNPTKTLRILGESDEVADTYKKFEESLFSNIDFEDKASVVGCFGLQDKVVNNRKEFIKAYGNKNLRMFNGEHRLNEKNIRDVIVPEVKNFLKKRDSGFFESLNESIGLNII